VKLNGKVALITGASRGIGRAVAEAFAREGVRLFLIGRTDRQALEDVLGTVRGAGGEARGDLADVGHYDDVRRVADQIAAHFGTLDILVNNAGVIAPRPLLEITAEQWDETIRTHLHGTFYCTREMVTRFMKDKHAGKVINVTAPSGVRASVGVADYASAKGGIIAFTRNAARELAPFNIQVNAILPVAETRMTTALHAYYRQTLREADAERLRTIAPPAVLGPAFVFLASSDSDYVTGQILAADGGRTL
jgi:3-oxoacyl-[acyl-carrier protein] reductase